MATALAFGCGGDDDDDDDDDMIVDAATPADADDRADASVADASPPDAEPFDCSKTPAGYEKKWAGTTSTDWHDGSNWDPAGVPTSTDDVFVCSDAANQPVLTAAAVANDLLIVDVAQLDTATFELELGGNLEAGTTIVGSGPVTMTGSGTTANGTVETLRIETDVAAGAQLRVPGLLDVDPGGQLDIAGNEVIVGDVDLLGGSVVMDGTADELVVEGDLFSRADVSVLTEGVIRLSGNLTTATNGNNFKSTGTRVELVGTAEQTLDIIFADLTNNRFADLHIANPVGVTVVKNLAASNVSVADTAGPIVGASSKAFVEGNLVATDGTKWQISETELRGETPTLPAQIGGSVRFGGALHTLQGDLVVDGDLFAQVVGQDVILNGHAVTVNGNASMSFGEIIMQNAADELNIAGAFGAASDVATDATFSAGIIRVGGNMNGGGNSNNFRSGGTVVEMNGSSPQTINFIFSGPTSNHYYDLVVATGSAITFATNMHMTNDFTINGTATVDATRTVTVEGTLTMSDGATLNNNGVMVVGSCSIASGATINGTNPCL